MAGILKVDRVQSDSNLSFQVGGANVAYFDVNDGIKLGTTKIGASLITTNGIAFPATQIASADANTLDDYEEGTWTPTLNGYSTNPSYTNSNMQGYYIKVGGVVHVWMIWFGNITSAGSGGIYVGGLPFTLPSSGYRAAGVIAYNGAAASTNSGFIEVGSNQFLPITNGSQSGVSSWNVSNTIRFFFQATYTVNT